MKQNVAILIPAYNPDEKLVSLVKELSQEENIIIVVNDGSKNKKYFRMIQKYCEIIEHSKNLGKGRALKTGFEYILKKHQDVIGVITADADGQHSIEDIQKIKAEILKKEYNIILGCRDFKSNSIPLRNKIGNTSINLMFRIKTGLKISDTQTGLRGININILKEMVNIRGEKYEYEMNVLLHLAKQNTIKEIPIQTIYSEDINSKFKPLKDSIKVLKSVLFNV